MEQYISKSALAAEIERLKSIQLSIFNKGESIGRCYDSLTCISVYNEILSFLDTLEVKEADLDKEYEEFVENDAVYRKLVNSIVGKSIAKHFFELGLKAAQKGGKV